MNAIIARPAAGATPAPARAKGGPRRSPAPAEPGGARHPAPPAADDARNGAPGRAGRAPARSEGDALALEAAEILQTLVVAVLYNESDDPRPGFNGPHAGDVDHYMLRLLSPDIQKRDDADPEEGDILDHLALISSNLEAMIDVADRDLAASTAGGRVLARAILDHAFEYAYRLFIAYKNLPGSLEDLRALTTYAGARPFRDRPQPPIRRVGADDEYDGPCSLTKSQLLMAMETAAGDLDTINQLLMQAQAEQDDASAWLFVNAAQALTRHCGGMVDAAAGESILGGHDRWNFGPNFATAGKAGAA